MSELLGASTDVLDRGAESLSTHARRVQDIRTLAQRAVTELQASWNGSDLSELTRQWERQGSLMLAGVCDCLDTCAARLRAQSAAQRLTSSTDPAGSPVAPVGRTPPAPTPPRASSPPEVSASWWRSLSPQQQQGVITDHPEWIGNRDGVAFTARDLANRALLALDRDRLLAEKDRIVAAGDPLDVVLLGHPCRGLLACHLAALDPVADKLASLAAIDRTLVLPGDRQLVLLDLSKPLVQAAIARGNIDTADNVAVFVSGLSTTVTASMVSGDKNMGDLRRQSEAESLRAHTGDSTAAVMWIGYQAPQTGWDLVGDHSVALDLAAASGASQLVPFLRGIATARDRDPHLTLLGHSYGSTTAGLALRQDTGVDDAVFFGSPGLGTSHVEDLKLAPGHAYYIEARQDPVGDLGRAHGPFGIDPSHLAGIEHASAEESTVLDPSTGERRHFSEVTGHGAYLEDQSTSLYNVSVVAAGLPDRLVGDDGEGVGDLLSWPIPGTY